MLRKVINLKEGLKLTCGAKCSVGRDGGDRRALLRRTAEVGLVGVVRDTKEPRCDEEYRGQVRGGPRSAGWHEERVRSRTAGTGADAKGKHGPDQACGDHGCAGSLEGLTTPRREGGEG